MADLSEGAAGVSGLAASGGRLVGGSQDGTLRVWRVVGSPGAWVRERTLGGEAGPVMCVAAWGATKAAAGMADSAVRVWDAVSGALERTVGPPWNAGLVHSLLVGGSRLTGSWRDGPVRAWSLETGACVATVECRGLAGAAQSLAGVGAVLVGGTEGGRLRFWSTKELVSASGQPAGGPVCALLEDGGELWGCVGRELVVWGRRGTPPPCIAPIGE